ALARGIEVRQGTEVVSVAVARGRVTGLGTREGDVACGALVNAAGAWARRLGELAGVEVPVDGYRRQVAVLEAERTALPLVAEELGAGEVRYLRAEGAHRILAGLPT